MIKTFIHQVRTTSKQGTFTNDELSEYRKRFEVSEARRLTPLALLLGDVIRPFNIIGDDTVVYATTYSESLILEKYFASMPAASPTYFQNSVHPSGIEQVFIARKLPITCLLPFAGSDNLMLGVFSAILLSTSKCRYLVGGEFQATWMSETSCASDVSFAYALHFSVEKAGAIGQLTWETDGVNTEEHSMGNVLFYQKIRDRQKIRITNPDYGVFNLEWFE